MVGTNKCKNFLSICKLTTRTAHLSTSSNKTRILTLTNDTKKFKLILTTQHRHQTQDQSKANVNIPAKSGFLSTSVKYMIAALIGSGVGLVTGYWLMSDESQLDDSNESTRSLLNDVFEPTKFVSLIHFILKKSFLIKIKFFVSDRAQGLKVQKLSISNTRLQIRIMSVLLANTLLFGLFRV